MPMENQTMQLPELPGPVPQNAETSSDIPQASAEFRTVPTDAEVVNDNHCFLWRQS